jgi:ATP-dependent RNA helicase RhlE
VLVATDIAARGIDIDELPHVVNYELPNVPRTTFTVSVAPVAPAWKVQAVSLVCVDEKNLLNDIERLLKKQIDVLEHPGFDPDPSIRAEPIPAIRRALRPHTRAAAPDRALLRTAAAVVTADRRKTL